MIYFHNDYSEGCHPRILEALQRTNLEQTTGYGTDGYCAQAANQIRRLCGCENLQIHFLVGGTQTNLTVIAAALRPHQAVIGAESAHVQVHETGAVEATGHKVLSVPSADGKIRPEQVEQTLEVHSDEHMVQPKMVYISNPTEVGTLYSKAELEALSRCCRKNGLYLFLDGARLGYGLASRENDMTMSDLAQLCDVFYIGGTKMGAIFGEAVVIANPSLGEDFRYLIKQRGGLLAKGRLLGIQFLELFRDDLYFQLGAHADRMADKIRETLCQCGIPLWVPGETNQIFPVFPDRWLEELGKDFLFTDNGRTDDTHRSVRICTSWATREDQVQQLCDALRKLAKSVD